MPAVIVEGCFIDNAVDRQIADTEEEQKAIGYAIANGIINHYGIKDKTTNTAKNEVANVAQTVMRLDNIWVQEIEPSKFEIMQCDCAKRGVTIQNYFNLGFFAELKGGKTIPVGNLAIDGKIITQACDNESWINVHKKTLSTMIVDDYGKINFMRTDRLDQFKRLENGGKRYSNHKECSADNA